VSELDGVFKALQIKLSTKDTLLLFDTLDADHDGVLSFPEFEKLIQQIEEIDRENHMRAIKSGRQRLKATQTQTQNQTNSRVYKVFNFFDQDSNGSISAKELYLALNALGTPVTAAGVEDLMAKFDGNADGVLSFEEFNKMIDAANEIQRKKHVAEIKKSGRHALKPVRQVKDSSVAKHRVIFQWFDKDGSGEIDTDEFYRALNALKLKVSMADAHKLLQGLDVDHSGGISFAEFEAFLSSHKELMHQEHLAAIGSHDKRTLRATKTKAKAHSEELKVFQWFDADHSGSISASELEKGLRTLGVNVDHATVCRLLAENDTDHDGVLSFEEFEAIVQRIRLVDRLAHLTEIESHTGRVGLNTTHPKLQSDSKAFKVFRFFDPYSAGQMDAGHIPDALEACGFPPIPILQISKLLRTVGITLSNGTISFPDFQEVVLYLEDAQEAAHKDEIKAHDKGSLKRAPKSRQRRSEMEQRLLGIFHFFDADDDGSISGQEMLSALRRIPELTDVSVKLVKDIYASFGRSFDDSLSYEEFVWFATHMKMPAHKRTVPPPLPPRLRKAKALFEYIDKDNSGTIDAGELMAAYKKLRIPAKKHEIFELVLHMQRDGKNKSGQIGFDDFCTMLDEFEKPARHRSSSEASVWSGPPPPPREEQPPPPPASRAFKALPPPTDLDGALKATEAMMDRIAAFRSLIEKM